MSLASPTEPVPLVEMAAELRCDYRSVTNEPDSWLPPHPLPRVEDCERFFGVDATVLDFWRWGFSDPRLNIVRGVLAEFLVARAVGASEATKEEWANFDVQTSSGVRVEVKASAYWQSWKQRGPSKTIFSGLTGRSWREDGSYSETREVRADVFVFALQACRDRELYDPLDVNQWEFRVLPARVVRETGCRSVGIGFLDRCGARPVPWSELAAAIDVALQTYQERRA